MQTLLSPLLGESGGRVARLRPNGHIVIVSKYRLRDIEENHSKEYSRIKAYCPHEERASTFRYDGVQDGTGKTSELHIHLFTCESCEDTFSLDTLFNSDPAYSIERELAKAS